VERQVKERLVGAAVLVALAVILIPELLSGPKQEAPPAKTPARNEQGIKTYEFRLDPAAAVSSRAPAESRPAQVAPSAESSVPPAGQTADPPDDTPAMPPREAPPRETVVDTTPPRKESTPKPAPSPPSATPPTESPRSQPASGGWAVQLGSFADEARAKALVQKLKSQGYNAYLVPLRRADGKTLQRVRIGPYEQRSAADAALQKVSSEVKGAAVVPQT
jgi:DedD protein